MRREEKATWPGKEYEADSSMSMACPWPTTAVMEALAPLVRAQSMSVSAFGISRHPRLVVRVGYFPESSANCCPILQRKSSGTEAQSRRRHCGVIQRSLSGGGCRSLAGSEFAITPG